MLTSGYPDRDRTTLVFLHFLGGSAEGWKWTIGGLTEAFRCLMIDLPGFGGAARTPGYAVAEMADQVADVIRSEALRRWILVGHSMGAKVATVLARRAENGEEGLQGLARLVLLAGSPPGPEPMDESNRQAMMGWFWGDPETRRAEARHYIDQNVGAKLDPAMDEQAMADILRIDRAAWLAWLDQGSREDWSERVGVLRTPALVVAGAKDADLGPDAQRRLMVPHFAHVRLVTLPDTGHLLPMEQPEAVARLIAAHAGSIEPAPAIDPSYRALIDCDRVSARTRETLLARAEPDDLAYRPTSMSMQQLATLRAVTARVVPQPDGAKIDLAARIDALLHAGDGDGWRFASLPPDAEAYWAGLRTLDAQARAGYGPDFVELDGPEQDRILEHAATGAVSAGTADPNLLDAWQMQLWFQDLRSDAVRLYVAHPATLARMGYGGIAYGGDTERKSGFTRIGAGEREAWEPTAEPNAS